MSSVTKAIGSIFSGPKMPDLPSTPKLPVFDPMASRRATEAKQAEKRRRGAAGSRRDNIKSDTVYSNVNLGGTAKN